jgi:hypothetical protein
METNEGKMYHYHEYLIRLDNELSEKLVHFSKENDMTLTGTVRRSLRQLFNNEEPHEPIPMVKNDNQMNENRNQ